MRDFPSTTGYLIGRLGSLSGDAPSLHPSGGDQDELIDRGFLMGGVSSIAGSGRLPLLLSSPIPQCEFDPIAYANLVVDFFKMVPDDVFADPKFLSDILIFQSLGY